MSPIAIGLIGLVVMFVLLLLGMPIAVSMALVGFVGLLCLLSHTAAFAILAFTPYETVASYELSVLPLFLLMANVAFASGITRDLYDIFAKWLGHQPGGLAIATIAMCVVFGAISSSVIATAVTVGQVALPELKRFKYDPGLATAAVCVGGPIDGLMPPSGIMVIYGIMTETSIGKIMIAGIIPAVTLALFYIAVVYVLCRRNPNLGPPGPSYSLKEKVASFGSCGEMLGLLVLCLGGLQIGLFTATEAGAVAAFGAILLSLVRRRLNWPKFKKAVINTIITTGMIYFLMIGAMIFTYFLAVTRMPFLMADVITGLNISPLLIMVAFIAMFIILGTFMDEFTMMLITVPIFFPLVLHLGFDPLWFGIMVITLVGIGGISPPYGLILFTVAGIAPDVPLTTIYKGVLPFLIGALCNVALLLFVPAIALFLPSLMR
jgi:C4-dicarboxylate transporter DctM subunit